MLSLLKTRRWIGFTLLVIVAIVGFGLLSRWQWDRAEQHRQERIAVEDAQIFDEPVSSISGLDEFTRVVVTGTYEPASTRFVRQRPQDGGNGFWVLTLFQPQSNVEPLWVIRGWVGAESRALEAPKVADPSSGEVRLVGAVRYFEPARSDVSGLPESVISRTSVDELNDSMSSTGELTTQDRILQRISSTPSDNLTVVELPTADEGQNISYAVQWILFAVVAIVGWFIFLRRETKDETAQSDHVN